MKNLYVLIAISIYVLVLAGCDTKENKEEKILKEALNKEFNSRTASTTMFFDHYGPQEVLYTDHYIILNDVLSYKKSVNNSNGVIKFSIYTEDGSEVYERDYGTKTKEYVVAETSLEIKGDISLTKMHSNWFEYNGESYCVKNDYLTKIKNTVSLATLKEYCIQINEDGYITWDFQRYSYYKDNTHKITREFSNWNNTSIVLPDEIKSKYGIE
ncbi:hypothetical protein [Haloplasma contractile]|uniref:Membrane lipoprotein n=1 Tax=Haloplasma contractile SSD-17B TaxID=1033810 RepID=U2FQF5_9MOLU|nr:hypothetical protein [Haloplasma contractile]ERJ13264.1 membrane lipoprotein [Haloplasma contractile SSD-17B]